MNLKLKSPVKKNLIANFYGVGITVFNQIILVPFYLIYWGTELYGDWIVLTAITSFFNMTNFGLNTVTQNQFVIDYSKGDINKCIKLLINNYLIVSIVFLISIAGLLLYFFTFDITTSLGLNKTNSENAQYILFVLILFVFLGMYSGIWNAIYRATSLTSKSIFIDNTARLVEAIIIAIGLIIDLSMLSIVIIYTIPRIILIIYKYLDTKKIFTYKVHWKNYDFKLLKRTLIPSFSFMSFPLGNAIIFQGFTLIINKYFGANTLVLFNTTRTLSNFARTLLNTVQNSVVPEYAISFGKKDYNRMRELHRKAFWITFLGAIGTSTFLLLFGNIIYDLWTREKVEFNFYLMLSFLIVLIVRNTWDTSSVTLKATNQHTKLGLLYIIGASLSFGLALVLLAIFPKPSIAVYAQLVMDLVLMLYAIRQGLKLTRDTLSGLLNSVFNLFKITKNASK